MVTLHNLKLNIFVHEDGTADDALQAFGLAKDTKPTDVPNSTPFLEMDTRKVSFYDAENDVWHPSN